MSLCIFKGLPLSERMECGIDAEEAEPTATELEAVQVSAHSRDWLRNGP